MSGGPLPTDAELYYVTNRRHRGDNRWTPDSYGNDPSSHGTENLRFGKVVLPYGPEEAQAHLGRDCGFGNGDGCTLSEYLVGTTDAAQIEAFEERLAFEENDATQSRKRFGSTRALAALQEAMEEGSDVLIFVHGFNVDWWSAVASALSLEFMLNRVPGKRVRVVLLTWPSDGKKIPWWS
ncbi:MAG: alpha/beta hydrolase [Gemmatimonadota bacterium]|nr:alpha/beta hydrolase [Gemmatimonadota bacterium]MDE2864287.1 alpha/beta hydrolase [Gemmatimonadota bacterium]